MRFLQTPHEWQRLMNYLHFCFTQAKRWWQKEPTRNANDTTEPHLSLPLSLSHSHLRSLHQEYSPFLYPFASPFSVCFLLGTFFAILHCFNFFEKRWEWRFWLREEREQETNETLRRRELTQEIATQVCFFLSQPTIPSMLLLSELPQSSVHENYPFTASW